METDQRRAAPPEATVVIPTRNRADLVGTAVRCALGQEDVDVEVVVVDDASTDSTPTELAGFRDPRLRVVRQPERGGVARARNAGIGIARGEWVAFLDDDDLWSPRKLRLQLDAAARACASIAYGAAVVLDEAGAVLQLAPAPDPRGIDRALLERNVVPGGCSNLIAKTALVRSVGGFDERLSALADWDLWIRLAQAGTAAACEETVVAYVRHPRSMVVGGEHDAIRELDRLAARHRRRMALYGVTVDRAAMYRYFARAHRRGGRRLPAARLYLHIARETRSLGHVARALGVLAGERALAAGAWLARVEDTRRPTGPAPEWLQPFFGPAPAGVRRRPAPVDGSLTGRLRPAGTP